MVAYPHSSLRSCYELPAIKPGFVIVSVKLLHFDHPPLFLWFFFSPRPSDLSRSALYILCGRNAFCREFHDPPPFPTMRYVCEYVSHLVSRRPSALPDSGIVLNILDRSNITQLIYDVAWFKRRWHCRGEGRSVSCFIRSKAYMAFASC